MENKEWEKKYEEKRGWGKKLKLEWQIRRRKRR